MKKRTIRSIALILIVSALLTLILSGCSKKKSTRVELAESAIELMADMLISETYKDMYNTLGTYDLTISSLERNRPTKPVAVYSIEVDKDNLQTALGVSFNNNDMSEKLRSYVERSLMSSAVSSMNSSFGVEKLMISSVFVGSASGFCSDYEDDSFLLFVYENTYPIAVSFTKDDDTESVGAISKYIFLEDFSPESEDEVESVLSKYLSAFKKATRIK